LASRISLKDQPPAASKLLDIVFDELSEILTLKSYIKTYMKAYIRV
jgi:hypothetical protein